MIKSGQVTAGNISTNNWRNETERSLLLYRQMHELTNQRVEAEVEDMSQAQAEKARRELANLKSRKKKSSCIMM